MPRFPVRLLLAFFLSSVNAAATLLAQSSTPPDPAETLPPASEPAGSPAPSSTTPDPALTAPAEAVVAEPPSASAEPVEQEEEEVWVGDLFDLGETLFETFAPEEIKERYRFPTREEWDSFAVRLQRALESNSLSQLAEMEPEARAALVALRALPDYAEYADWLEERLDDISVAQEISDATAAPTPPPRGLPPTRPQPPEGKSDTPPHPAVEPAPATNWATLIPHYDVWLKRMRQRPPPARAAKLVPRLKPVFTEASLPDALVWVAEIESSFNPAARSPVGARGLFQLMPGTAKDLGLRLAPFDERLDPLKNAHSAARYLNRLHTRFQDWPLALAAYNAGPGRVARLLKEKQAKTFAEIAEVLPAETRLYVPKVLATLAVREGVTPDELADSSARTADYRR